MAGKFFNANFFIITSILLLALFFRIWNINSSEIIGDEGSYALRAIGWNDFMQSGTLTTPWNWFMKEDKLPLWTKLSFNDHPPLHFAAIWLSSHIFGISLWSLRLPSVLFGIGAIFLLILTLQKLNYRVGSYVGGYFFAILPWHIFISRQAVQESLLIFLIMAVVFFLVRAKFEKNTWLLWIFALASFSLGMMTKYSMIVVFPLLVYFFIREKFYKKMKNILSPLLIPVILSPVIIYNIMMYFLRGHPDLQISRFLKMDTSLDWRASQQAIWQGNISNFFDYFKDISGWLTLPVFLLLGAGIFSYIIPNTKSNIGNWKKSDEFIFSYGMIFITSLFAVLTLPDFGRSSIIIPFLALGLSFSQEKILHRYFYMPAALVLAGFFLLFSTSLSDRFSIKIFPNNLSSSFYRDELGFNKIEEWMRKQGVSDKPVYFSSFNDWMRYLSSLINNSQKVIVYDERFIWWHANWYLYRHSFYSEKIPVVHSSFLQLLRYAGGITLKNKEIYFIEVGDDTKDIKGVFDPVSRDLIKYFINIFQKQNIQPEVIKGNSGKVIFRVWKFIGE